jgi:hypothetical protein
MRRETWWGVILGICAVGYAAYSVKQKVLSPGPDFSAPMWGNPFAVGFAWGTAGILVPVGMVLLFWSGVAKKLVVDLRGIGVLLVLAFMAIVLLGAWGWARNTSIVLRDDTQQDGWMLGIFTSLVAVSAGKTIYLGIRGEPMWKVRGRVKSKRFERRSATPNYTDIEYMDEYPIDDSDNLRIVNRRREERGASPQ